MRRDRMNVDRAQRSSRESSRKSIFTRLMEKCKKNESLEDGGIRALICGIIHHPISLILLAAFLSFGLGYLSGITGLFVYDEDLISHEQNVSWEMSSDSVEQLVLLQHPEEFSLISLKMSGTYIGNDSVRVYLETSEGVQYLILDNDAIATPELSGVTALFVEDTDLEEEMPEEAVPDYEIEEESEEEEEEEVEEEAEEAEDGAEEEQETEDELEEEVEEEVEEEEEEEETPEELDNVTEDVEEELNVTEEIEEEEEEEETPEELDNVTEDVEEELNVTEEIEEEETNVTEEDVAEAEINLTEDPVTDELNVSEELNITDIDGNLTEVVNITDANATSLNTTNLTINLTGGVNITVNLTSNATANLTSNVTLNLSANITENLTLINITGINITDVNITLNLTDNLTEELNITEEINDTEVNITEEENLTLNITPLEQYWNVEITDVQFRHEWKGSWGAIKEIVVTLDNQENQSITIGGVQFLVEGYDELNVFELSSSVGVDAGIEEEVVLPVDFSYAGEQGREVQIWVLDDRGLPVTSASAVFDPETAERVEEIEFELVCVETCLISDFLNNTEYDIVFEVEGGTLNIDKVDYVLKNLTKTPVDVMFGVLDHDGEEVYSVINIGDDEVNDTIYNNDTVSILTGTYDVVVEPQNHTIDRISFGSVNIEDEFNEFVRLDDGLEIENVTQSYAIKPLVEYNSSVIEIIAKGDRLYVCSDWSYRWQYCKIEFEYAKDLVMNRSYTVDVGYGDYAFIETVAINATNITYRKVKEDVRYGALIDSVSQDNISRDLTVVFHHDSVDPLPIIIKGRINYTLDKNVSVAGENVTLFVPGWNNERFRILVGKHTEAFEFGVAEELVMNATVQDSEGESVAVDIELIDSLTDESRFEKSAGSVEEIIEEGEYDIKIEFEEEHPISEIVIEDVEVYEDLTDLIDVEDVNETEKNMTEYVEVYAIDPTQFNFTNATVTVTATGTELYKCKDWNFTTQSCYGNWTLFKSGLVPGQDYTFELTPEDPGFAEVSTDAEGTALEYAGTRNLVRLNDGTLVGVWESDDNNIICAESPDNGATWAQYKGDNGGSALRWSSVATNGTRVYIVADQTGQGDLQYNYSDGGCPSANWVMTDITGMTSGFGEASIEYDGNSDEYIMCMSGTNNDAFYAYMPASDVDSWTTVEVEDAVSAGGSCGISANTDGQTWICYDEGGSNNLDVWNSSDHFTTKTTRESSSQAVKECDINARGDKVIAVTEHSSSNDLFVYYSEDSGANFSTFEFDATNVAYPTVCIDSNGLGHVLYWLNDADDNINYRNITSSGLGTAVEAATGAQLEYTAPICHNYPTNNRMTDGLIEFLYLDSTNKDIYFGNYSYPFVSEGSTPPSSVTNLANQSQGTTWIYWNWSNPADGDFNESIVYIDGNNTVNTSDNYYNATNLSSGTSYTITIHTKDSDGNVNDSDVNSTASTLLSNQIPTHTTPILDSTDESNDTNQNLTCYNQSTADADGDSVKNIFNWKKNSTSITVLNMPFEGGSNSTYTKDYSGNNNDGTVSGAIWDSTGGYDGKGAYEFDGQGDTISLGDDSSFNTANKLTLAAWIKPTLVGADVFGHKNAVIRKNGAWALEIASVANVLAVAIWNESGTIKYLNANTIMSAGNWYFVVLTYDSEGGYAKIYVNGEYENQVLLGGNLKTNSNRVDIGSNGGVNLFFNGTIDEASIYNYSLSPEQIQSLYENRTDLIVSNEISANDVWQCQVTPNDGNEDGITESSNSLTILEIDNAPPSSITNLTNQSSGLTWIYWNWTNSTSDDYSQAIVYINGSNVANTSNNYYNATGLSADTSYIITVHTKDAVGNVNYSDVNSTAMTLDNIPPASVTNLANQSAGETWVYWNWSNSTSDDYSQAIVFIDGSNVANTSDNYYNASGLSNDTSYTITIHTKDITGNVNNTDVNSTTLTLDATLPAVSIITPVDSDIVGWTILLRANASDNNIHIVRYEIRNGTINAPIIDSGDMNDIGSNTYNGTLVTNETWPYAGPLNSTSLTLVVYANDTSGNEANSSTYWTLDNTQPSIQHVNPPQNGMFVNSDFNLEIFLSNHQLSYSSYNITNSSGQVQFNSTSLSSATYTWNDLVDVDALAEGNYTLTTVANDSSSPQNTRTKTTWFYVDKTAPNVSVETAGGWVDPTPANNTFTNVQTQTFNFTCNETFIDTVWIDFNGTIDSSYDGDDGIYYWWTFSSLEGEYTYTAYCNDTASNQQNTETRVLTVDITNPAYSNANEPTDPSTYSPSTGYNFNITWTDNIAVDTVILEFAGVNYTGVSNASSVYYRNLGALTAGTHNYAWYANDTANNWNNTGTLTFNISQETTTLTLSSSPSWSETYGTETTVNCSADNSEVTPQLYRNGSLVSIPDVQTLAATTYSYVCNASATQNYTNASESNTLTINKASPTINLYLDGSESNKTITYGAESNATAVTNVGSVTLYRDGQAVSNPEIATLAAGTYNYTAVNPGNQNYTGSSATWFLIVNKASSAVNLLLNGTDSNITIEVHDTVNETGSFTTGENGIELYEAGSLVNSGDSPLTNLTQYTTLGTFNVTVKYPESENYSASEETHWVIVQDTTAPTLNLESPVNDTDIVVQTQGFVFNFTDNYYSTASCTLYIDDTASGTNSSVSAGVSTTITNTSLPEGNNNWYVNCTDASGNVGQSSTRTLAVDLTAPAITLVRPTEDQIVGYTVTLDADVTDSLLDVDDVWYEITNASGVQVSGTLAGPAYQDSWDSTGVSDGNYTFIVYANDSVSNQNNNSANFTVDNTQPFIQILTPTNGSRWTENFNLNITYQNTQLNLTRYNITNSSSDLIQSGENNSVYVRYYEFNDAVNVASLPDGTYTINAYALDSVGYEDSETSQFIVDNAAPLYSAVVESPTDPATYSPGQSYMFNITWTDDSIGDVILEFDGVNYNDATQSGNVYSKTITDLANGTYSYIWYANDSVNNQNNTGILTYSVNKEVTTLTLTASPSWNETSGTQTTINCSADNSETTPHLYRNGTEVSIPDIQTLTRGSYQYACNATSTQNYSAPAEQQNILTIKDIFRVSLTDPADQETNRTINATYTITITNNGTGIDTYTLTVNNIDNASIAQLNQSSVTINSSQNASVKLYVTDDGTVGLYTVNVTATSDNNASVSDRISITTTVFGTLSAHVTEPSESPPAIYYEAQDITFQGYVHDELDNAIGGATVIFEPIYSSYIYSCSNTTDVSSGYYNCTLNTAAMQKPHYYDVRINASKTYYHAGTFTNSSVFMLSDNQQANLSISKLPTVQSLNDTTIVYNISNILTNIRGTSQASNLSDPDAGQIWSLGNLGAEIVTRSYTLSFTRGSDAYTVTLNKSNATGYDPIYENSLFAESNQPVIVIPENETLNQLTLIKNLVYKNQTTTNVTYQVVIEVVNSGETDLENIEVTDTDISLDTKVNLTEGQSWQTSSNLLVQKNPQTYTKSFVKATASASGDIFYSNQPNITIPGYGGPYDVIITSLPNSVNTGQTIIGQIQVINQNTEVAEDRVLTTWIEDDSGNIKDIDIRTVYVGRNQSAYTDVSLTAPSSTGTYYFKSELVWPTATASATNSFVVTSSGGGAGGGSGGAGVGAGVIVDTGDIVLVKEPVAVCGDSVCGSSEEQNSQNECLEDCGYDCDGDGVKESWTRCIITIVWVPEDLKEDIITLRNKANQLENAIEALSERGVENQEVQDLLDELKAMIKEAEEKIAAGMFDVARNIIKNAYVKATSIVIVEMPPPNIGPTGQVVMLLESPPDIPGGTVSWVILLLIVAAALVSGVYYKYQQDQSTALMLLKARREKLERINDMVDNTIDKIYFKKRGTRKSPKALSSTSKKHAFGGK